MIHNLLLTLGVCRNSQSCTSAMIRWKGLMEGKEQTVQWMGKSSLTIGPKRPHIAEESDIAILFKGVN